MVKGCFTVEGDPGKFDLKPVKNIAIIPEEQRKLNHGIYGTNGVLLALNDQGVFGTDQTILQNYQERLLQVAEAGLAGNNVHNLLSANALEQIRHEIVLRQGRAIKLKYLTVLLLWAVLSAAIAGGFSAIALALGETGLIGFGYVWIGAMAGAWMSVAAARRDTAFDELPNFLDNDWESVIRLLFVGLLAVTVALLLQLGLFHFEVPGIDFSNFSGKPAVALVLGAISGIGEKALSLRITRRVSEIVSPSQP